MSIASPGRAMVTTMYTNGRQDDEPLATVIELCCPEQQILRDGNPPLSGGHTPTQRHLSPSARSLSGVPAARVTRQSSIAFIARQTTLQESPHKKRECVSTGAEHCLHGSARPGKLEVSLFVNSSGPEGVMRASAAQA